jgi:signal peptidase I
MLAQNPKSFEMPFLGNSMLPTLRSGDLLLIEPCSKGETLPGDLVVYYDQSELTVHRLLIINNEPILKGDAALDCLKLSEVNFIVGKVKQIKRDGKARVPNEKRSYYLRYSQYYSKSSPRLVRQIYHLVNFFFVRKFLIHKK